jgi:hypothetical protein
MSLRDYFAAKAMNGMLTHESCRKEPIHVSRAAYEYADAMLKAREE